MIELVSSDRCVGCGLCVKVCPTHVFDNGPDDIPVIARQHDCQTCFMCEVYCPVDALYVSPFVKDQVDVDEAELVARNELGSWRAKIGWGSGRTTMAELDTTPFIDRILPTAAPISHDEYAFILSATDRR